MSSDLPVQHHAELQAALRRLSGAVDLLEAAAERLDQSEVERRDLDAALSAMEEDRGRLAEELDAALKTKRALASAADEVAERLRFAGGALRELIGGTASRGADDPPQSDGADA